MKKISVLVVILLIFNFICMSQLVYADNEVEESSSSGSSSMSIDEYKKIADEGVVTVGGNERKISLGTSDVGSASSKLGTFLSAIAAGCTQTIGKLTGEGGFYYTESDFSAEQTGVFTINSLVFSEYLMFNAKAYQKSTDLLPSSPAGGITEMMDNLKERGSTFGQFVVRLGIMLALPMIVFAIIKTVMARKASDLAAWKKILVRWVLCLLLMMFFQYILAAIDTFADKIIEAFWNIRVGLENSGYQAFESTVIGDLIYQLDNTGGVTSLAYSFVFFALVLMQIIFFIKYVIRTFGIIFLFILAPAVMLIHSVNLMIGKNSNLLGTFFKSYIALVFMQPVHALFYLIFFFSFSEMVIKVPILGIILLYALYRAADIAKAMFGWELGSSIISLKRE